ncbi:hypothetical protein CENSYa_0046 [Cenarchaeum symbiosum A]|uniref:DUF4129 domain-containing protein n=1 Tax=Cenarchaeum symbiosum (strain A) TaxID=414004 RepID=A0RTM8_CENSY|nr:hypothetical protein CENSYa_0046 [Cenarchaeum symbiosum A]
MYGIMICSMALCAISMLPVYAQAGGDYNFIWDIESGEDAAAPHEGIESAKPDKEPGHSSPARPAEPSPEYFADTLFQYTDPRIPIEERVDRMISNAAHLQNSTSEDNWKHRILFWDRYGDDYVPLASALLDPLTNQTFIVGGTVYEENPNSNLKYFLLERGYDLDDLESVPNWVFSPAEYDELREAVLAGGSGGTFDMREFSKNHLALDGDGLHRMMLDELRGQGSMVYGDLVLDRDRPVQAVYEPQVQAAREPPQVLEVVPEAPGPVRSVPSDPPYLLYALAAVSAAAGAVLYAVYTGLLPGMRASTPAGRRAPGVQDMIGESRRLLTEGSIKEAHGILGRAIRLHYSIALGLGREATTDEVLGRLRGSADEHDASRWLRLCGGVEYAREEPRQEGLAGALSWFSGILGRDT